MRYYVKILNCDPMKWYSDRIGKLIEVETAQPIDTIIGRAYIPVENNQFAIKERDCIRVSKKN